jgi:hypothetical protein
MQPLHLFPNTPCGASSIKQYLGGRCESPQYRCDGFDDLETVKWLHSNSKAINSALGPEGLAGCTISIPSAPQPN